MRPKLTIRKMSAFMHSRTTMPQMVVADNCPSICNQVFGKSIISVDILLHAMYDLQHASRFCRRLPNNVMQLLSLICRGNVIMLFHT